MSLKPFAALLLPIAWSALPQTAQAVEAPLSEAMTVELVNVDVHVVDRDGRPIAGLTREDFRVLEEGRRAEISHFAWIPARGADSVPSGAGGETSAEPRHVAVLFDELQTGDRSRAKLIAALRTRLAASLRPQDRVSVLRFDGAEVNVLLDASVDRRQLEGAFKELGVFSNRRLLTANETRSALERLKTDVTEQACQHTGAVLRMYADTVLAHVKSSAAALLRAAQRLAPDAGTKVLLHVSDGIPMIAGGEGYEYAIDMCDGTAIAQGVPEAFNVGFDGADQETTRDRFDPNQAKMESSEYSTAKLWTDVAARINTLGVTIYALQAGPGDSRFLSEIEGGYTSAAPATARQFARENPRHTLVFLAAETGGLMIDVNGNETAGVDRLLADLGAFYSLAFAPATSGRVGLRAIRVEVDRPGAELRYRQSYRRQTAHERIATQLEALFQSERGDNPLGLSLAVEPGKPSAQGKARLTVPLAGLGAINHGDGTRVGRLTVYLMLRKRGGKVVPMRQRTFDIALPTAGAADANGVYVCEVALPSFAAEVALAALDEYSGKLPTCAAARRVRCGSARVDCRPRPSWTSASLW